MKSFEYHCKLCRRSLIAEKRDRGKVPMQLNCSDDCEYMMELRGKTTKEPGYYLIKPNDKELNEYMISEENRYIKKGFSLIECDMLFAYEQKKINKGILILKKKDYF